MFPDPIAKPPADGVLKPCWPNEPACGVPKEGCCGVPKFGVDGTLKFGVAGLDIPNCLTGAGAIGWTPNEFVDGAAERNLR